MKQILSFLGFFLFALQLGFAQKTISGNVTDQSGVPLPGATIIEAGTQNGVSTDFDGNFSITVGDDASIEVSFVGYQTQTIAVAGKDSFQVALTISNELEEVIVTGFGESTQQSFSGSAKVVAGENIAKKSFTNLSQSLAGEAPGVAVFNTSGQPGSTSTIRIRGFGSVNGSQAPLYVVDDAPFSGSLNDINPNDIKSITVLKDASATALYGARGSNGVIVVTTKRGTDAGDNLSIQVKRGSNYEGIARYDNIRSPEEYIGIAWEGAYQRGMIENEGVQADAIAYANANLFEHPDNDDISDISPIYNMWNTGTTADGNVDVAALIDPATASVRPGVTRRYNPENWRDFAFQPATRDEVVLTFSNSSDNSSLYTSFGYVNDKGYAANTDFKRLNARIAVTNEFADFVRLNTSINYSQSETNNNGTGSSSSSQFWWIDNIPSIYPLYRRDANGAKIDDPIYGGYLFDYGLEDGRGFGFATNGVADSQIAVNRSKGNSLNFNNDLRIQLSEGLTLENNFAYQYYMNDGIDLDEPFYSPAKGQGGRISRSRGETKNYTVRTGLRYNKDFNDFSVGALFAHVATSYEFNYLYGERSNLVLSDGLNIANGVVNAPAAGYTDTLTSESLIANVNANYLKKYYVNLSFNRDGSSRFVNNKWGNFWSAGTSWIVSKEDFMSNSSLFDLLKLKASYGVSGNSGGVGYYPGYNTYSINNLDGNISLAFTTKGNKDLTWESVNQFNAGVEFEMGGFLSGSVEVYNKTTTDMFFTRSVGPSVGYASLDVNDGELVNKGVEFDLNFDVIKNKDFSLELGINGESFKNELTAMPLDPATGEQQKLDTSGRYAREVGRSLYDYYMPVYAGVNPDNGAAQWERFFEDANANGTFDEDETIITSLQQFINENPNSAVGKDLTEVYADAADQFIGKTAIPDVRGAFKLNANYKRFSLSMLFNYQLGGWAYDFAYSQLMDNEYFGTNNFHVDIRNRWKAPGDVTDIPRQDGRKQLNQASTSSRFLEKADYLALNNIRLGYSVPQELLSKINVKSTDIYITGDNLWLLTERKGLNPSTAIAGNSNWYTYNPLSTIVFGLNINL